MNNKATAIRLFVIIISTVLVYFPVFTGGFIDIEDEELFAQDSLVHSLSWMNLKFLVKNAQAFNLSPMAYLSVGLDQKMWGKNPMGYHITNVVLFSITCCLLYLFIRKLIKNKAYAFIISLIYCVHPVNTASVAWISSRGLLLSGFFIVFSLYYFYSKMLRQETCPDSSIAVLLAAYIFGMFSSWRIIFLSPVLLLMDMTSFRHLSLRVFFQRRIKIHAALLVATTAYLIFVTSGLLKTSFSILDNFPAKVFLIFRFFFFPYPMSIIYPIRYFTGTLSVLCAAVMLITLGYLIRFFLLRTRHKYFVVFYIVLSVVFGVVFTDKTYYTHRLAFFPSIGLSILVAFLLDIVSFKYRNKTLERILMVVLVCLAVGLSAVSFEHNLSWQNSVKVWNNVKKHYPEDTVSYNHLGKLYIEMNDLAAAQKELQAAIRMNPDDLIAYVNLGLLLQKKGQIDPAIETYKKALRNNPSSDIPHYHLYHAYYGMGDIESARLHLLEAVKANPDSHLYRGLLGDIWRREGKPDKAIEEYKAAIDLYPLRTEYYGSLGSQYMLKKDYDNALRNFSVVLRTDPKNIRIKHQIALIFFYRKNYRQAKKLFRDVLKADPLNFMACYNLAMTLTGLKEYKKAHEYFNQAIKLNPTFIQAIYDQGLLYKEQGENEKAARLWRQALRVNPNMHKTRLELESLR